MKRRTIIRILAGTPVIVGIFTSVFIASSRNHTPVLNETEVVRKVSVIKAERTDFVPEFDGFGIVKANEIIEISPQVSGRITTQNPRLSVGEPVSEGDVLFTIETIDFEIEIMQAESALEKTRQALEIERGRQAVAQKEWEFMNTDSNTQAADSNLVLRQPQLKSKLADLKHAEAALKYAKLQFKRATITSPCNGIIMAEDVAVGNVVQSGQKLIKIACCDKYRIEMEVPVKAIPYLKPKQSDSVFIISDSETIKAQFGQIAPQVIDGTQFAKIIAYVNPDQHKTNLLLNSHVKVHLFGQTIEDVIVVPGTAIRPGNRLWILNQDNRLEFRQIHSSTILSGNYIIHNELDGGEKIITSPLALPLQGMKLEEDHDA